MVDLTTLNEWKNSKGIQPMQVIPTDDLTYGVNRENDWWDQHPLHMERYEKVKESIKTEGLQKPLEINKDMTVETGNQRLKALRELGVEKAPCVWYEL